MRCPLLTFTQETKGEGTPVATQSKVKLSVSLTVLSSIGAIVGGTAIKSPKRKRKIEGVRRTTFKQLPNLQRSD